MANLCIKHLECLRRKFPELSIINIFHRCLVPSCCSLGNWVTLSKIGDLLILDNCSLRSHFSEEETSEDSTTTPHENVSIWVIFLAAFPLHLISAYV